MPEYYKRDVMQLDKEGNLFSRHMEAMTGEGLYDKAEIAAELAYRDSKIAKLEKANAVLTKFVERVHDEAPKGWDKVAAAKALLDAEAAVDTESEFDASAQVVAVLRAFVAAMDDGAKINTLKQLAYAARSVLAIHDTYKAIAPVYEWLAVDNTEPYDCWLYESRPESYDDGFDLGIGPGGCEMIVNGAPSWAKPGELWRMQPKDNPSEFVYRGASWRLVQSA